MIGVEVAGAVKVSPSPPGSPPARLRYTRAALITRGLAEIARFAVALGGRAETMGLAGVGDMVLTCAGMQSRHPIRRAVGAAAVPPCAPPAQWSGVASAAVVARAAPPASMPVPKRSTGWSITAPIWPPPWSGCWPGRYVPKIIVDCRRRRNWLRQPDRQRGARMAYWLFKSGTGRVVWDEQVAASDGSAEWDGVRNYQAANNMKAMAVGDRGFFYHSVNEKRIVGIVEVTREYYPDPTDASGRFGMVDVRAVKAVTTPVTLADIKAEPALADLALVRQSRLSVVPVNDRMDHRHGRDRSGVSRAAYAVFEIAKWSRASGLAARYFDRSAVDQIACHSTICHFWCAEFRPPEGFSPAHGEVRLRRMRALIRAMRSSFRRKPGRRVTNSTPVAAPI